MSYNDDGHQRYVFSKIPGSARERVAILRAGKIEAAFDQAAGARGAGRFAVRDARGARVPWALVSGWRGAPSRLLKLSELHARRPASLFLVSPVRRSYLLYISRIFSFNKWNERASLAANYYISDEFSRSGRCL